MLTVDAGPLEVSNWQGVQTGVCGARTRGNGVPTPFSRFALK